MSSSSSPMQPRASVPPRRDTPSPRASSSSLAAAATLHAADLSRRSSASNTAGSARESRASERRRSIVAMNLDRNDPTLPSPGELSSSDHRASLGHSFSSVSPSTLGGTRIVTSGDPHHHQRTPSLGEIHQELEMEQEGQVNRMLHMIREQQLRLDQMRTQAETASSRHSSQPASATTAHPNPSAILDDLTPASERGSFHLPLSNAQSQTASNPGKISSNQRQSSSRSPALRALDAHSHFHDLPPSPSMSSSLLESATVRRNSNSLRDESAYYQAETASLTRENQMLKMRIRELEKQVGDMGVSPGGSGSGSGNGHGHASSVPAIPSPLIRDRDEEKS